MYGQTFRLCHLTRKDGSAGEEDYSLNGWVEPQSKLSIRAYTQVAMKGDAIWSCLACVARVSNRVTFFCSRPNFLDEFARKRLLRRLGLVFKNTSVQFRLCFVEAFLTNPRSA